ncbi:gene transfer agent family protein [Erythrobacter sp. MTPC3]|uniref:gene transfer agent family protein n=1 Tax=Erythrobacter sp. MTPC3 TaxID=3056564 RepID=UPI0036F33F9E
MSQRANPLRGEAEFIIAGSVHVLRPDFTSLVCAEEELGSLFAFVERASQGALTLNEMAALIWHCLAPDNRPERKEVGDAVLAIGLVAATQPVKAVLTQVLQGRT